MVNVNRQFRIAARPVGMVKVSDFRYAEEPVPEVGEGQALVRTLYLSLDPSMRGQMENRADYVAPLAIGDVMRAGGIGVIERSRNPAYPVGTMVSGTLGMQTHVVTDGRALPLRTFAADTDPVAALGVFGGTGMTAYFGMLDIGRPVAGNTVVVSGAAGATGSIAGQIANLKGCRVIGIAGSAAKCRWLTDELGFEAAIDYRAANVGAELDRLCPKGIDVYFDNVGGTILDLCLARLAMNARVVLCGGISRYNATGPVPGPVNYFNLVFRRARMEGFIVLDYAKRFEDATREMRIWIDAGRLKHRATIVEGFENLPQALIRLFEGDNIGKMMVKV
jgi:NADPH-dependent curcumin reductase CurA